MFPTINFDGVDPSFAGFVRQYGAIFEAIKLGLLQGFLVPLDRFLHWLPPWAFLIMVGALAFGATRRWLPSIVYVGFIYFIGAMGLWDKLMSSMAIVTVSTVLCIVIGIPLGILVSRSKILETITLPILDVAQTIPPFVYLIPGVFLLGLGQVPAIVASVVYALAPVIRLTNLGIRQVDPEVIEAAKAFGVTSRQLLLNVQLPLARPSIMAGVNQTVLMSLAMVAFASLVGARGLGETVLDGISNLKIGVGIQGGLAIVLLAIVIDRITQGYGMDDRERRKQARKS
jgi:ABC-type proline/glycine betaine transport system permease subunit